jgi:hypothetical protein
MEHIMHIRQLWWQLQSIGYFTSLLHNLERSNESRCELAWYLETVKTSHRWHLEVHKTPNLKDQLSSAYIAQLIGSLSPYELASRLLVVCRVQTPSILQSHSKKTGFGTYEYIASQMAPSSNSLGNYCCRRTQHMTDSYLNIFRIAEHKLSAYIQESDWLSRFDHQEKSRFDFPSDFGWTQRI